MNQYDYETLKQQEISDWENFKYRQLIEWQALGGIPHPEDTVYILDANTNELIFNGILYFAPYSFSYVIKVEGFDDKYFVYICKEVS